MRVMCIDDRFREGGNNPKVGEIVSASQCEIYPESYRIHEYLIDFDGREQSFRKIFFAPLSDIDERELLEQRQEELVSNF
jgi:hypothetical protein